MNGADQSLLLPIAADHAAFAGHFPQHPVVPGVVLLDETLHALAHLLPSGQRWRLQSAKFHGMVAPGEIVQLAHRFRAPGQISFDLRVEARLVARGLLTVQA